jgi:hypothetical protein
LDAAITTAGSDAFGAMAPVAADTCGSPLPVAPDANGFPHDGMRTTRAGVRRDVWGIVVLGLGALAVLFVFRFGGRPSGGEPAASEKRPAASVAANAENQAASTEPTMPSAMPRSRGAKLRALRALGVTPERGADGKRHLDAAPVIDALNRAGVHEGIAAFPPPGTDPPKTGVIVPDGVELPEGYVRHYQTTDDGQPLPPILMFHPDYTFTDEQGNPVAIPPDRVVPPELVPPGIPVQMLSIPARDGAR